MLGIPVDASLSAGATKEAYLAHAERTSREIMRKFPRTKMVANTFRFDTDGAGIQYYTALYGGGNLYYSTEYHAEKIVDKVGSGDCFMAGLIYGQYCGNGFQETLEFATAAAFQKLFISNDATTQRVEEVKKSIIAYEQ
jgi:2-dehydro-3-deoxygluconokinase